MEKNKRRSRIRGSATLVIIITSIVFMLYAQSTRADVVHMTNMHKKYKENILQDYKTEYNEKMKELNI